MRVTFNRLLCPDRVHGHGYVQHPNHTEHEAIARVQASDPLRTHATSRSERLRNMPWLVSNAISNMKSGRSVGNHKKKRGEEMRASQGCSIANMSNTPQLSQLEVMPPFQPSVVCTPGLTRSFEQVRFCDAQTPLTWTMNAPKSSDNVHVHSVAAPEDLQASLLQATWVEETVKSSRHPRHTPTSHRLCRN